MNKKRLFLVVLSLALVFVPLTACGVPATAAPVSQPTVMPIPTDVPAEPASLDFPVGIKFITTHDKSVGLKFNEDGTWEAYYGGTNPIFVGLYSVSGDLITTENPTETDPKCLPPATYKWSFDGEKLTFSPNGDDPCKARRDANAEIYVMEK